MKKIKKVNQNTVSVLAKVVALDNLNGMWTNSMADRLFTGIVFGIIALSIINGNAMVGIVGESGVEKVRYSSYWSGL